MIKKYRKRPVVIKAVKWDGKNTEEIFNFCQSNFLYQINDNILIKTLEGNIIASPNDFIIKGIQGEFYPCKPDIFFKTYEELNVNE